jgi:hypothetical protein
MNAKRNFVVRSSDFVQKTLVCLHSLHDAISVNEANGTVDVIEIIFMNLK